LYLISALLLAGLLAIMIVTVVTLRSNGTTWMDETGTEITTVQVTNINSIATVKSSFVKV
jgi:hypothetical protein